MSINNDIIRRELICLFKKHSKNDNGAEVDSCIRKLSGYTPSETPSITSIEEEIIRNVKLTNQNDATLVEIQNYIRKIKNMSIRNPGRLLFFLKELSPFCEQTANNSIQMKPFLTVARSMDNIRTSTPFARSHNMHRRQGSNTGSDLVLNQPIKTAVNVTINLGEYLSSHVIFITLKGLIVCSIIIVAIFGNSLVIISVIRFHKLRRVITNRFVLSLAFADLLVSSCVMTFSASIVILDGKWTFGSFFCDLFNANDVLFSTASIAHLACISMDRYISIKLPFRYSHFMTNKNTVLMILICWLYAFVVSYIPIFTGLYSTPKDLKWQKKNTHLCEFLVNPYFGVGSSIISFWIPCILMTTIYAMIYKDARQQEDQIFQMNKRLLRNNDGKAEKLSSPNTKVNNKLQNSDQRRLLQKEHKAAKTLGVIMGCFIVCWLPFFLWMTIKNLCTSCPPLNSILIDTLFWIGYFNSTLNPIIYAFYQQEFRKAFKKQLKSCFCVFDFIFLGCHRKRNIEHLSESYVNNSCGKNRRIKSKII